MNKLGLFALAAASSIALATPANASLNIDINEVGGDVVATLSGTLDLTGLTNQGGFGLSQGVAGDPGYISFGSGSVDGYSGFSGPADWGTNVFLIGPTSTVGGPFAINADDFGSPYIFVDSNFISGGALAGTTTFAGTDLATLGLNVGQYVYTSNADTITVTIGRNNNGAVPEPGTWAMMLLGFGAMGWSFKRRRKLALA